MSVVYASLKRENKDEWMPVILYKLDEHEATSLFDHWNFCFLHQTAEELTYGLIQTLV